MGHQYAWADTCCVNKASSAELSTALTSMYRWAADAPLCIAYLYDIYEGGKPMWESEWSSRGWTLQELIAPVNILFYDKYWKHLGTKIQFVKPLSNTTRIAQSILDHSRSPGSCSIARRMSWAADRQTERVEDRAYSLMGLFGVPLDMIYGERENTFIRTRKEIISHFADQSILAWSLDAEHHPNGYCGYLAPSPSSFASCDTFVQTSEHREFTVTNIGLSIKPGTAPYGSETCLSLRVKVKLRRDPSALSTRDGSQFCIWTVDLTDLGATSPEHELEKAERRRESEGDNGVQPAED